MKPLVFVSYSHEDAPIIERDVRWLRRNGFDVNYDRQIEPGTDWRDRIAEDLIRSAAVLFFSSVDSNRSKHCLAEIGFALDEEKPIVVVKLDDTALAPGLRMYLGQLQAVLRYQSSEHDCRAKILRALNATESSAKHIDGGATELAVRVDLSSSEQPGKDPTKALITEFLRYLSESSTQLTFGEGDASTDIIERANLHLAIEDHGERYTFKTELHSMPDFQSSDEINCPKNAPTKILTDLHDTLSTAIHRATGIQLGPLRQLLREADTKNPDALRFLLQALCCYRRGEHLEAMDHFSAAADADQQSGVLARAAAICANNLGQRERSRSLFQRAIKFIDQMTEGQREETRAHYFLQFGQFEKAAAAYSSFASVAAPGSDRSHAFGNLALALLYARKPEDALDAMRSAVTERDDYFSQANLATYLLYAGKFSECEEKLTQIGVKGSAYQIPATMALCQVMLGQMSEAKRIYESLLLGNGQQKIIGALGLADALALEQQYDLATETLRHAPRNENDSISHMLLAYEAIYSALGDKPLPTEALADAGFSAQQGLLETNLAYVVGRASLSCCAKEVAITIAGLLVRRPELNSQVYGRLLEAETLNLDGQFANALDILAQSAQMIDTWMAHYLMSQAYIGVGSRVEAFLELETCVRRRGEATAVMLDEIPTTHLYGIVNRDYNAIRSEL